ncbi:MAG: Dyp-type peroxidase [Alphaproteobacteria bacterium]|nr:Dyp-type peroxidase [Alphaproteobacteria bacterium]
MATPQTGIFAEGSAQHFVMEYGLRPGANLAAVAAAVHSARSLASGGGPNLVVAFGAGLWQQLAGDRMPADLRPFEAIAAAYGAGAPATQGDLLFWIHGARHDENFDVALDVNRIVDPEIASCVDQSGFINADSRDLTGFIDGTANPSGQERQAAALIPVGEVGAGGAFVLSQRWVHDLGSFGALPEREQENVIGRTKADSIELEPERMPHDSHVSRTDTAVDGAPLTIYRRSFPYGSVQEHGLYFLAFSRSLGHFDILLRRMFGVAGDGIYDRLIEFSRPVSGAYWYAPPVEDLGSLGS